MPLSRVQQEKASVAQHSVSGVLCHSQSFKEPHLYCSFVTSPCSSAQAALGRMEQAVTVENSQAQGAAEAGAKSPEGAVTSCTLVQVPLPSFPELLLGYK